MLGFALVGAIGIRFPQVFGNGFGTVDLALRGAFPLALVLVLPLVKAAATAVTRGSGGAGGIFTPTLFLGAMMGSAFGSWVHALVPNTSADPGAYALVGMGAMLAGTTQAPLTAILMIFELTGDPSKIDHAVPAGPLGLERQKCDFAKRAVAYGASLAVQKYMQDISETQELLGALADCLIWIFAMDSAVTRTMQLVQSRGEERSQVAIWMTQLFVSQYHEKVFDLLREMLMWVSQDEEWGRGMRDINTYYALSRVNTFSLRRKIAKHTIESGGYAL